MVGQRQKPVDQLVFRRGGRVKALPVAGPASVRLPMPAGLGEVARATWAAYWSSPVSGAVDVGADGEALRNWILCVDERERLRGRPATSGRGARLVQWRLSELNREIARAEEHLGLTPLARMRLGITLAQAEEAGARVLAARERRRPHVMPPRDGDAGG